MLNRIFRKVNTNVLNIIYRQGFSKTVLVVKNSPKMKKWEKGGGDKIILNV